jgi:hypothetical protein
MFEIFRSYMFTETLPKGDWTYEQIRFRTERGLNAQYLGMCVRQFIADRAFPSPRVLEIGPWPCAPLEGEVYDPEISLLLEDARCCAVDVQEKPAHARLGEEHYLIGDFLEEAVQRDIETHLSGQPDVIIGNLVFDKDIGRHMRAHLTLSADQEAQLGTLLTVAATGFLAQGGYIALCNIAKLPPLFDAITPDFLYESYGDPTRFYSKSRLDFALRHE